MKTVKMHRGYTFRAGSRVFVAFKGGMTYQRVTEAAVAAIVKAKAGEVVKAKRGADVERSEP